MLSRILVALAFQAGIALAAPAAAVAPTVLLDNATVTGVSDGGTSKFLGIPYALPPTGDLRFRLPVANAPYITNFAAKDFGKSCPQQAIDLPIVDGLAGEAINYITNTIFGIIFPDDEDCLTVNVVAPAKIPAGTKLPVVAWIFGGGFELGSTSMYDGAGIVERSIDLGTPIIYVSMNYRVTAFGFLPGKEVKEAGVGNLGLQDQRQAFRWIQKYIGAFGGDPTKVTIWGESAGAISVALHMVANNGNTEGLFRGGFMQSGSPIPVGDITNGQKYYDALVRDAGCSGSADTLECLRTVPYNELKAAVDKSPGIFSYQSLILAWLPRADGLFLTDNPQKLVQQGKVANIPFVTGDCDDEGTLFSLSTLNVTNDSEFRSYVKNVFLPGISDSQVDRVAELYPNNILAGSPFGTGILNVLTFQFKRIAAFIGDGVFQAPRRYFLEQRADKQPAWVFLSKRLKALPALGSVHASDILNIYAGGELADYLIRFVVNLDPNGSGTPSWPRYSNAAPKMMTFTDSIFWPTEISNDDYRKDALKYITELTMQIPI